MKDVMEVKKLIEAIKIDLLNGFLSRFFHKHVEVVKLRTMLLVEDGWEDISFEDKILILKEIKPQDDQNSMCSIIHYRDESKLIQNIFGKIDKLTPSQKAHVCLIPWSYKYDIHESFFQSEDITVEVLIAEDFSNYAGIKIARMSNKEAEKYLEKFSSNELLMKSYQSHIKYLASQANFHDRLNLPRRPVWYGNA